VSAHVLIVDDNLINLKLAAEILLAADFSITTAVDAETARQLLATDVPDLILMDIALPGMDGLTLTRLLKADMRLGHIPIVALTAYAMRGDDLKAIAAGCDGYITKPINTRTFADQVSTVLSAAQLRRCIQ
jgi:CheY-like chemotaxis protein